MQTASSSTHINYGFPTAGPQEPSGSAVMDHVFFVSQSDWKQVSEEEKFHYIIIGSGFCALAFAQRALENDPNARILIIERGPFFLPEHVQNLPLPYQRTMCGLSETFPWTVSSHTISQEFFQWQHGVVPFFGGRSTVWSSWCPSPTPEEMRGWPQAVVDTAREYFNDAKKFLNVVSADRIEENSYSVEEGVVSSIVSMVSSYRPIYGILQKKLFSMLFENLQKISSATRVIPAPLAVGSLDGFQKFSTPGPLLSLIEKQRKLHQKGQGSPLKIVTNCVVTLIEQQDGEATALKTSRGVVNVGKAKIILAMGTVPPTTLVLNSFPQVTNVGNRFTSHFISAIIARVRRADFDFHEQISELELAAIYLAGQDPNTKLQYHVQLTALSDRYPEKNAGQAARHMPDVGFTASMEQLLTSKQYVIFVCAVLGEMRENNQNTWLKKTNGANPTTNVLLQAEASPDDIALYGTMEEATFQALELVLSPKGSRCVQYWRDSSSTWEAKRPPIKQMRVPGMVHEASTMPIGDENDADAAVGLNYELKGVQNVYVTGASLWPTCGSWNPTLTMVALAQHLADNLSRGCNKTNQLETYESVESPRGGDIVTPL